MRRFVLALCLACLGIGVAAQLDTRVQLTQRSEAQAVGTGGGLVKCSVSGGILSGDCTVGSPITTTISTDGSITGTGSAGSPLSGATTLAAYDFGVFGDGSDGACNFDGVATPVAGATLSGSTYTLTRDVFCDGGTLASGKVIKGPYRVFDKGTFTLSGTIQRDGNPGSGSTGGAALGAGSLPSDGVGGAGTGGNGGSSGGGAGGGGIGENATAPNDCTAGFANGGANGSTCQGGGGGSGAGGAGAPSGNVTLPAASQGDIRSVGQFFQGRTAGGITWSTSYQIGSGGGGGRGDAVNVKTGGGGGGGAGYLYSAFKKVTGSGSITAIGGAGADGQTGGNTGGGGGGAGGYIITLIGTGSCPTQTVTGGAGGAKQGTGGTSGNGGAGIAHCYKLGY